MIVNHQKQFVFVHVPKVAGTSIQVALLQVSGSERPPKAGGKHILPQDAIGLYRRSGTDISHYLFFAFVRNPWDRFASFHRYLRSQPEDKRRQGIPETLHDFALMLEAGDPWLEERHSIRPQSDFIRTGEIRVGRYENLNKHFGAICEQLQITCALGRRNATAEGPIDHRPLYTNRAAEIIAQRYAEDINRFDYTF